MHCPYLSVVLALALLTVPIAARADTDGSQADYDRAAHLEARTRDLLPLAHVEPHWSPDSKTLWYPLHVNHKTTYIVINAVTGAREERTAAPTFPAATQPASQAAEAFPDDDFPANSPDGHYTAIVRRHNVVLVDRRTHESVPLTTDASEANSYSYHDLFWSPDSSKLVALKTLAGQQHPVSEVESSPTSQLQPILHTFDYLKPGDKIPLTKPHLFSVADKKEIAVPDTLFPNRGRWRMCGGMRIRRASRLFTTSEVIRCSA